MAKHKLKAIFGNSTLISGNITFIPQFMSLKDTDERLYFAILSLETLLELQPTIGLSEITSARQ